MAATTGSLFNTESIRIREILNNNLEMMLPVGDPIWRDTIVSSQGVYPAGDLGRDMLVKKRYHGSFTGVLEQANPRDDFVLYGDATTGVAEKLFTQSAAQTFPDPLDGPNPRTYGLAVPMRAMVANSALTLGELQMEATPAVIGDVIAPKLEGWSRNMVHTLSNYWYLSQNSSYALSGTSDPGSSLQNWAAGASPYTAIYYATFKPTNYAVDRYVTWQRVDIYDSTGATRRNIKSSARVSVWVARVDELANTVTLATNVDPSTWTVANTGLVITSGSEDLIVYANSRSTGGFTGIAGYNSWMKFGDSNGATANSTNCLLGAERETTSGDFINVNLHPEFKSFRQTSVGVLTEQKLRNYCRGFARAKYRYGQYIDTLIASDGVWLAYEAQKIGRERLDRTGRLSSLNNEGSEEGMKFTFEGRTYEGYTSTYMSSGELVGIRKGGNNWKRLVPPSPAGVTKFQQAASFVPFEFVGPALTGTSSNRLPIYKTDATGSSGRTMLTEVAQMPGMLRMQLIPDQPAMLSLTGITEERVYSN